MGRKIKKQSKLIIYLLSIIVVSILSFVGIEYGTTETVGNTMPINIAKPENLQNITIKTGPTITKDFLSETKQNLKVYFFDVGQADSILIMNEEQTMLIDAGNNDDGEMLVKNLEILGITKIDYLVGTHPHEDHIGGMDNIIKNFEIGTIYMPKVQTNTKTFEDVLDAVREKELTISTPKVKDTFKVGKAECQVLAVDNKAKNLNITSIVIQMQFDDMTYLFTGDSEKEVEEKILKANKDIKVNILKVGHHGSDTSSSEKFIQTLVPEISVISVGRDNSYGHPNQEVVERLEEVGSKIYRTDEVGNVFIEQRKNRGEQT
ncbi:MAG: MBL fold metallo-hydrolase [Clostridia bacterium]|nr:MBL fold metallo-hydrolase [Clostridia bacterium]